MQISQISAFELSSSKTPIKILENESLNFRGKSESMDFYVTKDRLTNRIFIFAHKANKSLTSTSEIFEITVEVNSLSLDEVLILIPYERDKTIEEFIKILMRNNFIDKAYERRIEVEDGFDLVQGNVYKVTEKLLNVFESHSDYQ